MTETNELVADHVYFVGAEICHDGLLFVCARGGRSGFGPPIVANDCLFSGEARFLPAEAP